TSFTGTVTVGVKAAAGNPNTASLVGTTTITASQGFAVINNAYLMQNGGTFGPGNNYQLTASAARLKPVPLSNPFQLNPAAFDPIKTPSRTIKVTLPGGNTVTSGKQFEVDVQLLAGGKPTGALNGKANVGLELRNGDGSLLIPAPGKTVTLAYNN